MLTKVIEQAKIDHFTKWFERADKIVIVSHVSPDGDAIGSSLGLYHFLDSQEKTVNVIVPNAFPDFLKNPAYTNKKETQKPAPHNYIAQGNHKLHRIDVMRRIFHYMQQPDGFSVLFLLCFSFHVFFIQSLYCGAESVKKDLRYQQ